MFIYTMSKKRAVRTGLLLLAVFVGIAIGIAAILTAINVDAKEPKLPIYSVDRTDNKIAVTFDCAWGNSNTDELLAILKEYDVKATFFVTGEFCDKTPADVKKFYDAGHEIANHSDLHPHVQGMNINNLIADTKECSRKIEMITGTAPTLYRSPYGEYDDNTVTTIEGMGYKMIQWSVDSVDWKEPDPATMTKRVVDNTVSGSILLFHNDLANTTEALPVILAELRKKDLTFVPVSEMIYDKDYHIDHSGKQIFDVNVNVERYIVDADAEVAEVMAILTANFTEEELLEMREGISLDKALRLNSLLTEEQLALLNDLSAEAVMASVLPDEPVVIPDEAEIFDDADEPSDLPELPEQVNDFLEQEGIGGEDILEEIKNNPNLAGLLGDSLPSYKK